MNKYYLTAKSLMWTKSLILQLGFLFGFIVSCATLAAGMTSGFLILACICSLGIGHRAYVENRAERRMLVPGQRETVALVCVLTTIGMWLVVAFLSIVISGWELCWPGLSLLAISFCVWFGWGENRVITFVSLFPLVALINSSWLINATHHQLEQVNHFLYAVTSDQWQWARNTLGILIGLVGSYGLIRFWKLATTKIELVNEYRLDDLLTSKLASLPIPGTTNSPKPALVRDVSSTGYFSRLQEITTGKMRLRRRELIVALIAFSILAGCLFGSRNDRNARFVIQFFASPLILALPASFFLTRVPPKFSRLWVMGVSNSRAQTGRWLAWLAFGISFKWLVAFAVLSLIQSGFGLAAASRTLIIPTISFGIGGILLLIAAWGYHFLQRHADITLVIGSLILVMLLLLTTACLATTGSHSAGYLGTTDFPESMMNLLLSAGFAIVCWGVTIYGAGIGLARSNRLLE